MFESVAERFWSKTDQDGDCWYWTGALVKGYGIFQAFGSAHRAHRVAYTLLRGEIPSGLVIDHVCHDPEKCPGGEQCLHRRCVNPDHMMAVTTQRNLSRERRVGRAFRDACFEGHEFTPENTRVDSDGGRRCRICARDYARERSRMKRATDPAWVNARREATRRSQKKRSEMARKLMADIAFPKGI